MIDFDNMTDDEIDDYLATQTREKTTLGRIEYSWLLIIAGLVGAFASFQLLRGEWELAADPYANLACDVNEILACSTFLTSWEGSLLGFSNSYIGLAGFIGLIGVGLTLLIRRSFPSFVWIGLGAGAGVAFLALLWFQYTSFIEARTLCPWCLVIWASLIPFITYTVGQIHSYFSDRTSVIWRLRFVIVIVWYLAIVAFAFFYFLDTWKFIFGWN